MQSDSAKETLIEQLVGQKEAVRCFLALRQDEARLAEIKAAIWRPSPVHFDCNPNATQHSTDLLGNPLDKLYQTTNT